MALSFDAKVIAFTNHIKGVASQDQNAAMGHRGLDQISIVIVCI
jgi:hypothetical protein